MHLDLKFDSIFIEFDSVSYGNCWRRRFSTISLKKPKIQILFEFEFLHPRRHDMCSF